MSRSTSSGREEYPPLTDEETADLIAADDLEIAPPEERSRTITVRLNAEEFELFGHAAERAGEGLSTYLKKMARRGIEAPDPEVLAARFIQGLRGRVDTARELTITHVEGGLSLGAEEGSSDSGRGSALSWSRGDLVLMEPIEASQDGNAVPA